MKATLLIFSIGLMMTSNTFAQKYFTRSANVSFYSETPVEDIEAHNHQATSVVDLDKQEMVFSILIKSFEFEKALMQEHFNEKYMESNEFPKAQFKGTYTAEKPIDLKTDGEYSVKVSGDMTIHGVTKKMETTGTFTVKDGKLAGTSEFNITVADYDIEIPGVVRENIAKVVKVTVEASYEPYKK